MTENLSLNGAGGVTNRMTFEQKRRAAFEEFSRGLYKKAKISTSATNKAHEWSGKKYKCLGTQDMWEAWQAALEWNNKVESE